jgi:signal transduction histidine kinase/ActR/RegA family two-component response regulator
MIASSSPNLFAHQLRVSALEAEVSRFQRFARDAPIGIVFIAGEGSVQFANDEYLRIIGRSREEFETDLFSLEGSAPPEWLSPDLGSRYETEHLQPDGTRVPILVGISRQPEGLAAFVIDLTSEKKAQRARQESEERYRGVAERLEEADRRKNEFLGILSHELRNPLAPIRNALHILSRAGGDSERASRAREVIERQIVHLSRLVDDLLDVTRITRGRIQLHRGPLDLAQLVRDTVEDHRAASEAAGIRLVLHLPPAPLVVEGDPTRLAQILGNLLTNSAKFTPRGGTITVRLEEEAAEALLQVRDTGEGIDAEILPRIFEPFSQADRSLARTPGGLGLGLSVVKGLVELHGGTVAASSAGHGAGTEVTVRLPRAPGQVSLAPQRAAPTAVAHVLVVEDNQDAAETLRIALELEGMTVTVAGDGAEGLAAARRLRPGLIICDIGLPGELDGYGVARAIRADHALRDVPLVAVTGYASADDRARAREAGFDRHLAKPASLDDLLRVIASLERG